MPQSWIQPQQSNNLLETFGQVQQVKAQRAQNALYAAKAAELPYERERVEKLNDANIGKVTAQTRSAEATATKTDAEFTLNMVEWIQRDSANEPAVIGAFQFAAGKYPQIAPVLAKLESARGTPEFKATVDQFSMTAKDKATQLLNERQFTHTQEQSAIDNTFQQGNLDVARTNANTSQANAAESARHHGVMEKKEGSGLSLGYDEQGRVILGQGGMPKLTEGQARAGTLSGEAEQAHETMTQLEKAGYDPTSWGAGFDRFATGSQFTNWLASPEGQQYEAAKKQFIASGGYLKSGANVPESEFETGRRTYSPQMGDHPGTTEFKENARERLLRGSRVQAGPAGMPNTGSVSNRTSTAAPSAAQIPAVRSDADYDQLPSGARFTDPQGRVRVKP